MTKARENSDYTGLQGDLALKSPVASPSFTGNVGINNSSPTQRLETNGNAQFNMYDDPSGAGGYYTTKGMQIGNAFDAGLSGGDDDRNAIVWNERGTSLLFGTNNIEHMRINADGIVTKPLQPAFMALATGATNLSRAAWHTLAFGSERFDNNNDFSSNTFTAPVTGKYQMNVFIRLHSIDNAGHYYFLSLNTSNNTYYHIHGANGWANDPDYHTMGSSYVVDMDAGDTAIVKFYQASGSEQTDIWGGEGYFSGCLVA